MPVLNAFSKLSRPTPRSQNGRRTELIDENFNDHVYTPVHVIAESVCYGNLFICPNFP